MSGRFDEYRCYDCGIFLKDAKKKLCKNTDGQHGAFAHFEKPPEWLIQECVNLEDRPAGMDEELWAMFTREERRQYDLSEPGSLKRNDIMMRGYRRLIARKQMKVRDLWLTSGSSALNADDPKIVISIETWGEGWAYDIKNKFTEQLLTAGKCHNFNSVASEIIEHLMTLWENKK